MNKYCDNERISEIYGFLA